MAKGVGSTSGRTSVSKMFSERCRDVQALVSSAYSVFSNNWCDLLAKCLALSALNFSRISSGGELSVSPDVSSCMHVFRGTLSTGLTERDVGLDNGERWSSDVTDGGGTSIWVVTTSGNIPSMLDMSGGLI